MSVPKGVVPISSVSDLVLSDPVKTAHTNNVISLSTKGDHDVTHSDIDKQQDQHGTKSTGLLLSS